MKALAVTAGIVFWTLVLGVAWLAFFPGSESSGPVAVLQIEPATAPGAGESAEGSASTPESVPTPPSEASQKPAAEGIPPAAEAQPPAPGAQTSGSNVDLPPGFAVAGPSGQPQAPATEPVAGQDTSAPSPQATPAAPPSESPEEQASPPASQETPATSPEEKQAALGNEAAPPAADAAKPATGLPSPPANEAGAVTLPEVPVAELVEESQYGPLPKVATDGRRPVEVYARPSSYAGNGTGGPPRVAVLLVGLGLPDSPPASVIKGLPGPVSIAYGAYGRSLQDAVKYARADGHEVLLQIPLEPNNYPTENPGAHTLLTSLPPEENMKRLQWMMSRYTGYVGVTNLMGAKFEASPEALTPVLEELKKRGLLYVDDGSVHASTTSQIGSTIGLDYAVATVQSDGSDIAKQLAKLEATAKEKGAAVAVVKVKLGTAKQLADWAEKLQSKGIVLVPVSAVVRSQRQS
jgi:polysaccharide deacetylase 2 family uncharacterized protein YibQ